MNEKDLGPIIPYKLIKLFWQKALDPDKLGFYISKQDCFYLTDYCKYANLGKFKNVLCENLPEIYAAEEKLNEGEFIEISHEVLKG